MTLVVDTLELYGGVSYVSTLFEAQTLAAGASAVSDVINIAQETYSIHVFADFGASGALTITALIENFDPEADGLTPAGYANICTDITSEGVYSFSLPPGAYRRLKITNTGGSSVTTTVVLAAQGRDRGEKGDSGAAAPSVMFRPYDGYIQWYDFDAGVWRNLTSENWGTENLGIVAGAIANVNAIGSNIADVMTVSGSIADVTTVAESIADVRIANANIADVTTVSDSIANVNSVAGYIANVISVADDLTNINTVSDSIDDVSTVAGIDSEVSTVAGMAANVAAVAGAAANVATVAGIDSEVATVAGAAANVATVATDLTGDDSIGTVADWLDAGGPAAANVAYNNSASGLAADDVQDAIDETVARRLKIAICTYERASGVDGGTATTGSWIDLPISTERSDQDGIVSLSGNDMVLGAGKYVVEWDSIFNSTYESQTRLEVHNGTTSTYNYGSAVYCNPTNNVSAASTGKSYFELTAGGHITLQYRVATTVSSYGLGIGGSFGNVNVFRTVKITKLP